jgi:hypothetical protein
MVSSYWPRASVPARCIWTRPPAPRRPRPAQSSCPSWIRTIAATTVIRKTRPARSPGAVLCPSAPGVDGRVGELGTRRGTHPVSRSGPGETCGGYSGCSGNTAIDNVSSPQQKPLGGYGEDTLIRAGDNGGYARKLRQRRWRCVTGAADRRRRDRRLCPCQLRAGELCAVRGKAPLLICSGAASRRGLSMGVQLGFMGVQLGGKVIGASLRGCRWVRGLVSSSGRLSLCFPDD